LLLRFEAAPGPQSTSLFFAGSAAVAAKGTEMKGTELPEGVDKF